MKGFPEFCYSDPFWCHTLASSSVSLLLANTRVTKPDLSNLSCNLSAPKSTNFGAVFKTKKDRSWCRWSNRTKSQQPHSSTEKLWSVLLQKTLSFRTTLPCCHRPSWVLHSGWTPEKSLLGRCCFCHWQPAPHRPFLLLLQSCHWKPAKCKTKYFRENCSW